MPINNTLQFVRGNTSANEKYTGKEGELTVELDNTTARHTIRVHDGSLPGGYRVALFSDIPTQLSKLIDDVGFATQAGDIAAAAKAKNDWDNNEISKTYAKLAGATFTGVVKGVTPVASSNDTSFATTAWVAKADCVVHRTGNETINGEKTFTEVIKGTALKAYWADLAENYDSDFEYPYGTLICFGGDKEVTIAVDKVNGVVSRQPALLMNRDCIDGLPIALAGRVDVLVKGSVSKFDNIVLSDVAGVGVVDNEAPIDLVIGKALRDKADQDVGCVLCATKFNLL